MERKKGNQKVRFKKIAGGSLYFKKQRIKKGEVFEAVPEEIPESFRSQLIRLDGKAMEDSPEKEEAPVEKEDPGYVLKHRGVGWWDVLDKFGKQINDAAVRKEDAQKLLDELNA